MQPEFLIKKAESADIGLLSGLIRRSFRDVADRFKLTQENCPKHPSNCTDEWIEKDFARGVTYYVLEHDGLAAGCVALEIADADLCYLERLGVLPDVRRNGFGRALVDHVISEAAQHGARQISIGIIADDIELKQWYGRIGFREGEIKTFEHLPFRVCFMMYEM